MKKTMLITGGAEFIGVNTAKYFADLGWRITLLDNFSRRGTESNLKWLQDQVPVQFEKIDIRKYKDLAQVVRKLCPDTLLHLAAQVAVTTSVVDPRDDFENNAWGTRSGIGAS